LHYYKIIIPIPSGDAFKARIAASPPELPPGVLSKFHGFYHI
jgi:hypothetical protein